MKKERSLYSAKQREVKASVKEDKQRYIEERASEAGEAARRGEMSTVYKITKELSGKKTSHVPVKGKDGKVITNEREQGERWKMHFQEVLNLPDPEVPAAPPAAENTLNIGVEPPSLNEVREAITAMKSGKAAGVDDQIQAELLKVDPETTTAMFYRGC